MNLFIEHKRIITIVAAVLVAVLVVYSYGSFTSYAAAPEVSTLPVDVNIDVSYDADTITFIYNSNSYSISRKSRYEWLNVSSTSTSIPYTLETNISGYYVPASYWFSPSENRLYVFSGTTSSITSSSTLDDFSYILGYVASSNNNTSDIVGNFYTHNNKQSYYTHYMYFVDYNNDYICNSKNVYSDGGRTTDRNMCYWNSNTGSYINGVLAYKFLDENPSHHYFPTDLVCIFSNYNISGFYDIDTSKVNTPSYYFNYQYIYYNKDFGYIFVDCADRLREVGYPNGVNNPRFYFNSICNSYVYTSLDGITWTLKTTLSTLYSDNFELSTSVGLAGNLQLIYTNDNTYGEEPLVTPDYGDITDITDNLDSFLNDYNIISVSGRGSSLNSFDYSIVEYPDDNSFFGAFMGTLTMTSVKYCVYENISSKGSGRFSDYIHVYYFASDAVPYITVDYPTDSSGISSKDPLINLVYSNSSLSDCTYSLVSTANVPTLSMYFRLLNNTTSNIFTTLTAMRTDLHADLKSIFKNITLTNQYLSRIYSRLNDLKIPSSIDYSSKFDKLSAALDMLHNDISNLHLTVPDVVDYSSSLDKIVAAVSNDFTKPYSMGTYSTMIYNKLSSFNDMVSTKFDTVIAAIPSSSGGGSFDDSNMVGAVASLKSELSGKFDTLLKLLNNDTDDITDFKELYEFLTSYIVSMGNAAYFTTLLDFADGVKNNVILINDTMGSMVSDSGIYAPVFVLGAGFAVFSGLIRKERMS